MYVPWNFFPRSNEERASREAGKSSSFKYPGPLSFSMSSASLRVGRFAANASEGNEGAILSYFGSEPDL